MTEHLASWKKPMSESVSSSVFIETDRNHTRDRWRQTLVKLITDLEKSIRISQLIVFKLGNFIKVQTGTKVEQIHICGCVGFMRRVKQIKETWRDLATRSILTETSLWIHLTYCPSLPRNGCDLWNDVTSSQRSGFPFSVQFQRKPLSCTCFIKVTGQTAAASSEFNLWTDQT